MMSKLILKKPIISEKSEMLSEKSNKYSFVVDKRANKIEIKLAVEARYGVNVTRVNTVIMPSKKKVKNTRSGMIIGRKPAYKKAIVSLADGEEIDFFNDL